ncbi:UNVERIFIED_ORG: OHCU decarboxylase [Bacillus sp. B2I3]|nr:OHCU decarboxylase [Bacillus sp. B2I3]
MIHATLNALNEIPLSEFVEKLKDIFEHSPWVAQRAGEFRPFSSCESLYERMFNVVQTASEEEKLNLIQAHPHLGTRKTMSSFSQSELKTAGLSQLSEAEYEPFAGYE